MNDPKTYIEKDTVLSWGAKISKLNDEALEIIDAIETEVKNLGDSWKGNAANGFNTVVSDLITDARKYHNDMKSVENITTEVVVTAENQ